MEGEAAGTLEADASPYFGQTGIVAESVEARAKKRVDPTFALGLHCTSFSGTR